MARLLVVSRSMALALRLADSHDVVEHPAETLETLDPGDRTDVVVLDVGEPAVAVSVLDSLRRRGSTVPVLIVSGYQPAWAGLAALDLPGVVVVPLPITRTALLTGIERLESGRRARSGVPVGAVSASGGISRPAPPPADELPTMVVPAFPPAGPQTAPAAAVRPAGAEPYRHPGIPEPGYYTDNGRPAFVAADAAGPDHARPTNGAPVVDVRDDVVDLRPADDATDAASSEAPTGAAITDAPARDDEPAPGPDGTADVAPAPVGDATANPTDDLTTGPADDPAADATAHDDQPSDGHETTPPDDATPDRDDRPTAEPATGSLDYVAEPNLPVSFVTESAPLPTVLAVPSADALPLRRGGPDRPAASSADAPGAQFDWWQLDEANREPADLFVPARPISPHEALTEAIDLSTLQAAMRAVEERHDRPSADAAPGSDAASDDAATTPGTDVPGIDALDTEAPEGETSDAAPVAAAGPAEVVDDAPALTPPADAVPVRPEVVDLPATFLAPGEQTVEWSPATGAAAFAPPAVEIAPVVAQVVEVSVAAPARTVDDAQVVDAPETASADRSDVGDADDAAPVLALVRDLPVDDEGADDEAADDPVGAAPDDATSAADEEISAAETTDSEPLGDEPGDEAVAGTDGHADDHAADLAPADEAVPALPTADQAAADEPASDEPPVPEPADPAVSPATPGPAGEGFPSFDEVLFGRSSAPQQPVLPAARHASGEFPLPANTPAPSAQAPGAHRSQEPADDTVGAPEGSAAAPVPPHVPAAWSPSGSTPPPLPAQLGSPWSPHQPPPLPGGTREDILAEVRPAAGLDVTPAATSDDPPAPAEDVRATDAPQATAPDPAPATASPAATEPAIEPEPADLADAAPPAQQGTLPAQAADRTREPAADEDHWSVEETASMVARRRALLGRDTTERQPSALQRRLGDRRVSTGLSTGGASPELVALSRGIEDGGAPLTRRTLWGRHGDDGPPPLPPVPPSGPAPDEPADPVATAPAGAPVEDTVDARDEAADATGTAQETPLDTTGDGPRRPSPDLTPEAAGDEVGEPVTPAAFAPPIEASPWGRPFTPPVAPPPWAPPAPDLRSAPPPAVPAAAVAPPPGVPAPFVPPAAPSAAPQVAPQSVAPAEPPAAVPPPLPNLMPAPLGRAPSDPLGRLDPPSAEPLRRLEPPQGLAAPAVALAPELAVTGPALAAPRPPHPVGTPDPVGTPARDDRDGATDPDRRTGHARVSDRPLERTLVDDSAPSDAEDEIGPLEDAVLERRSAPSVRALVRALNERSGELFGVSDTCQVLAHEVVERAVADAAAVVVPDGSVWRVSGGVGLRPIERRLVLDARHWLVTEVALGGQALVVGDSAAVRPRLAGAPLAGWEHLLAVPVPDVNAAVVVARSRNGRPFTQDDLEAVVGPVHEAVGLLSAAVATRRLARLLAPLAEDDDV